MDSRRALRCGLRLLLLAGLAAGRETGFAQLEQEFRSPPADCRPHTRWWWMGNALRKEDIRWQLRQMHAQGIGGVEQITMQPVYTKGNPEYLSPEYFDLITYAVAEAKSLGMEVSLNFGGPGWVIGGAWVPPEDRSQNMVASSVVVQGPTTFLDTLPLDVPDVPGSSRIPVRQIDPEDRLVAVVAGRIEGDALNADSLQVITRQVEGRQLKWEAPPGTWRIMAFWLKDIGGDAVDHFDKGAMERYCDTLGGKLYAALGEEFGKTVDSLFCDSFEVPLFQNALYWNELLLDQFRESKGYDLTPYLPALWWEAPGLSPEVRYDVNAFLHAVGLDTFFKTFLDWCAAHGIQGRIQPYGFPTDIIESAGMTHVPEMEITAGEKDAVPWFDTRIGPKKYVASGAHLYGRNIVTTEAYTYLHWEPYRATLEELKIASDVFLRAGANKFYNHGYIASPERDIAPSRGFFAAIHISHDNVWWPYYRHLSDYLARSSYLLRQGHFVADVAIYSPLANQWAMSAFEARKWTRLFDWGELGKLLLANGFDFDLINDDILQNHTSFDGRTLKAGEMQYQVLLLPKIKALPRESMEKIAAYVDQGGVVIALERIPEFSTGLENHDENDARVQVLASALFAAHRVRTEALPPVLKNGRDDAATYDFGEGRDGVAHNNYGRGRTYVIQNVMHRTDVLDRKSSTLDPFLNTLRTLGPVDFGINFWREGIRENAGLAFIHRKIDDSDLYFVTNIQDRPVDTPVAFRVSGKRPWQWNPHDGSVTPLFEYRDEEIVTRMPVRLAPYASMFYLFGPNDKGLPNIEYSDFREIGDVNWARAEGWADHNGPHQVQWDWQVFKTDVRGVPAPFRVSGTWRLSAANAGDAPVETKLPVLFSWTGIPGLQDFSGTADYAIAFDLPEEYVTESIELRLSLGAVANIGDVSLNGQPVGVVWMRGQDLDITDAARAGTNDLELRVTNTLITRVAGLRALPPVPEDLREAFGEGIDDTGGPAQRLLGYKPLPPSGLLGPVVISALKRVEVPLK